MDSSAADSAMPLYYLVPIVGVVVVAVILWWLLRR